MRKARMLLFISILALILALAQPLSAQTSLTLNPSQDTFIMDGEGSNMNFGACEMLLVRSGNPLMRSLVQFNLSAIPNDANILSATLRLLLADYELPEGGRTQNAHRITRAWVEGTGCPVASLEEIGEVTSVNNMVADGATWNTYDGTNKWATPGGDFQSTATAGATLMGPYEEPTWIEWNVTSDVQAFVRDTYPNHGWLIKDAVEDGSDYGAVYVSRDFQGVDLLGSKVEMLQQQEPEEFWPQLVVVYQAAPAFVPEASTVILFGSGLSGLAAYATLAWRARRKEGR